MLEKLIAFCSIYILFLDHGVIAQITTTDAGDTTGTEETGGTTIAESTVASTVTSSVVTASSSPTTSSSASPSTASPSTSSASTSASTTSAATTTVQTTSLSTTVTPSSSSESPSPTTVSTSMTTSRTTQGSILNQTILPGVPLTDELFQAILNAVRDRLSSTSSPSSPSSSNNIPTVPPVPGNGDNNDGLPADIPRVPGVQLTPGDQNQDFSQEFAGGDRPNGQPDTNGLNIPIVPSLVRSELGEAMSRSESESGKNSEVKARFPYPRNVVRIRSPYPRSYYYRRS